VIPTPRLRGERIGPAHQDALDAIVPWAESAGEHDDRWERDGFGYWIFFAAETGAAVGRGGLGTSPWGMEVGWAVAPDQRGRGYATEIGAAAVGVAFDLLDLTDVVAYTEVDNDASRRVMEKLGFEYEREVEHAGLPHVLYRLRTSSPRPPVSRSSPSPP
jgi:RimJ/RimL family protein N-acetyltransferase